MNENMKTFLAEVAQDLIKKYGNNLSKIAVVFPNKRASLFLNEELAKRSDGPIWSPSYITISELFRQQSALTIADPIKSLCVLYKTYIEKTGKSETLDEFYSWGQLLLADFDDIDKNMADAKIIFRNLKDLHELDTIDYLSEEQKTELSRFFANFSGDTTVLKERFLNLWSKLYDIYCDFKAKLKAEELAYEGMLYRDVVEKKNYPTQYETYIFIGFNVLQTVEQKLFSALKKEGKARFYWDFDHYYLKATNEAGVYINKWFDKFPNEFDNNSDLYNHFEDEKEVHYVSAPTENLQARYISEWLLEKERYKAGKRTAVVMCNESLLQTVIHCVPTEVDLINVTTGYPLSQTPISSMVWQLIALQTEGYSANEDAFRLKFITHVLRHPYGKYLIADASERLTTLRLNKQFYIKGQDIGFIHVNHDNQHIIEFVDWLSEMVKNIAIGGKENDDQLFQESTFRMYTLLNKLSELMKSGDLIADYAILRRLLSQLISSTSIPFHGEPAHGVQIMGVLETRNLDFDNILLLSCNEGNMPKGVNDNSFIPHIIRKAYGLTTIDNKVAIFSYYFHRILQRAKHVTLLYNNSTQGTKTAEMSRFMLQLMVESNLNIKQIALQAGQEPMNLTTSILQKDEVVMAKLNHISYFSPTAINTYRRCELMFYYKYLAQLKEPDNNEEDDIDNRIFGNIFHLAAELIYERLLPREVITKEDIEKVLKSGKSVQSPTMGNTNITIDDVIAEAFARELFLQNNGMKRLPKLNGLQIIKQQVIKKLLLQMLELDKRTAPMRVIKHEFDIHKTLSLDINGTKKEIKVGGRVDRLDEVNLGTGREQLRVVDYKTGNKVAAGLKDVEAIFNPSNIAKNKSDYTFQALLYSLIEQTEDAENNPQHKQVSPALLFIQHAKSEDYSPILKLGNEDILDSLTYAEEFETLLKKELEGLFTKETFEPTTIKDICKQCPYQQICGINL